MHQLISVSLARWLQQPVVSRSFLKTLKGTVTMATGLFCKTETTPPSRFGGFGALIWWSELGAGADRYQEARQRLAELAPLRVH